MIPDNGYGKGLSGLMLSAQIGDQVARSRDVSGINACNDIARSETGLFAGHVLCDLSNESAARNAEVFSKL